MSNDNKTLRMAVEGMRCASCASHIEDALNKEPGVSARVNLASNMLTLSWDGDEDKVAQLMKKVSDMGYKLSSLDKNETAEEGLRTERFLMWCLRISALASIVAMISPDLAALIVSDKSQIIDTGRWLAAAISIPAIAYAGTPFFVSALSALRNKHTNMDVPISVALILTTAMSLFETVNKGMYAYFDSATMLLFLLLIGRYLDRKARGKARSAAKDLLAMTSGYANVVEQGAIKAIPIRELRTGMLLQIAAGESIPADGVIEEGQSDLNPSFITGETTPQFVRPGDTVLGGTINLTAPLRIRLTATADGSILGEIIKLMEKAEQGHAAYVRLADRIARYYTPTVFVLSLITFALWYLLLGRDWQYALLCATTVLIVTCPCAVGLAVPAVQVLTSGRLFRKGMLLKSADALEKLAFVDTIVFDKTGTLTTGRPRLSNPAHIGSRNMQIAASLASRSRHVLARALYDMYGGKILDMSVAELPGKGLEATLEGKTIRLGKRDWCTSVPASADDSPELWLAVEGETPVRFSFADDWRSDARLEISRLKQRGYKVLLLSGDREQAVAAAATELGIEEFRAQASPIDKAAIIDEIRKNGGRVLMVGDGLNDAPALASADVSMSPSSALDIAQNAADIVFQGDKLSPVSDALALAIRSEALVRQNFVMSLVYNSLSVPLAMLGLVTPLIAAIAMAGSSILVVLNSQRILRDKA